MTKNLLNDVNNASNATCSAEQDTHPSPDWRNEIDWEGMQERRDFWKEALENREKHSNTGLFLFQAQARPIRRDK